MTVTVRIDEAGRIALPQCVREHFQLQAGDRLMLEYSGDAIMLRPQKTPPRLRRINGVLVLTTNTAVAARDDIRESREEWLDEISPVQGEPKPRL